MFIVFSVMVGAALGSFCCCQAWRIHYGAEGKKIGKRSICLSCKRKLRWYENVPILSWILQRGKCRGCGRFIGYAEIISEVIGGIFGGVLGYKFLDEFIREVFKDGIFLYSSSSESAVGVWIEIVKILLVIIIFIIMGVIAIYDAKWGEMPTRLLWGTVGLSIVLSGIGISQRVFVEKEYDCCPAGAQCMVGVCIGESLDFNLLLRELSILGASILLLAGIYYILYKVSKEKWVGGGDWILCLAIAFMLQEPFLALLELTVSNILGVIAIGIKRAGKNKKKQKKEIPFGPFLVIGCMIIFSFSDFLIKMI